MLAKRDISLCINGKTYQTSVEPRLHLGDLLREELKLTGTHLGCEHGVCGSCTVIVNGLAVRSCLMLAVQADGTEVTTIEGLSAANGDLSPLQNAFWKHHALQCGFCTPGMLTTLTAFLTERPTASEEEIRDVISGNICRCTGYETIVDAALDAAQTMRVREQS